MKDKIKLTNVVLYAKGWYLETDNIFNDLIEILKLDDYSPFDKHDVYSILLSNVQNLKGHRWTELREVLNSIHPNNCWKHGYYTKGCNWTDMKDLPEYDMMTSFVYYVLSNLRFIDKDEWTPSMPKVNKYPKGKGITIKKLNEHFGKKVLIKS